MTTERSQAAAEAASGGVREPFRGTSVLSRVFYFYVDGFRAMTIGRTLWAIIAIKLFVFFVVIKWLFFPDFLSLQASDDSAKAAYVRGRMAASAPDSVARTQPVPLLSDSTTGWPYTLR